MYTGPSFLECNSSYSMSPVLHLVNSYKFHFKFFCLPSLLLQAESFTLFCIYVFVAGCRDLNPGSFTEPHWLHRQTGSHQVIKLPELDWMLTFSFLHLTMIGLWFITHTYLSLYILLYMQHALAIFNEYMYIYCTTF